MTTQERQQIHEQAVQLAARETARTFSRLTIFLGVCSSAVCIRLATVLDTAGEKAECFIGLAVTAVIVIGTLWWLNKK
jgi:hypothetical protein